MIILRKEQQKTLYRIPRTRFENRLIAFVYRFYEREYNKLGKDQVKTVVQFAINRAKGNQYTTQRQVTYYLSIMILLGSYYDEDIQLPWARKRLTDLSVASPTRRIEKLWKETLEYLETTTGEENEYVIHAILRIRDLKLEDAPHSTGEEFAIDLCKLLLKLYPQKYQFQGEKINRELIKEGITKAGQFGIVGNGGRSLFIILMFVLGSGFYKDLLYPWATSILENKNIHNEENRIIQLHTAAVDYARSALSKN